MRTRTFFGLILLVAALLVASTPQLLEPTARGVELLGITAGVMPDPGEAYSRATRSSKDSEDELEPTLKLKGHLVDENGDLRQVPAEKTRMEQRNRLGSGSERVSVTGSRSWDPYRPNGHVANPEAALLDTGGCPVFPADADIAAMMADPETRQRYSNLAASADDPKGCRAELEATIKNAVDPVGFALPGDRRQVASSIRSDSQRLMFDLYMGGLYEDLFDGWVDAPKTAVAIRNDVAGTG